MFFSIATSDNCLAGVNIKILVAGRSVLKTLIMTDTGKFICEGCPKHNNGFGHGVRAQA